MANDTLSGIEDTVLSSDYVRKELKKYALKFVKDMSKATYNAVSAFYSDYSPFFYQRKFGMKNPFKVTTNETNNGAVRVLFTYSSEFIYGHKNPDIIFDGPFEQGYHGGPHKGVPAPKMSSSPMEMIEDFFDNYTI